VPCSIGSSCRGRVRRAKSDADIDPSSRLRIFPTFHPPAVFILLSRSPTVNCRVSDRRALPAGGTIPPDPITDGKPAGRGSWNAPSSFENRQSGFCCWPRSAPDPKVQAELVKMANEYTESLKTEDQARPKKDPGTN